MISVEKGLLQELIDIKIRVLQKEIEKILAKWTITEAEDDAVCLRNVLDDRDEAYTLKIKWNTM
ncbi:MAG TPA: hypothetical protein VKK79_14400 [Candidatus Lokiarchaeia archaeon]|nr:hypothetical protein [Candidatus Lokiarchaeia archaeon]